MEGVTFRDFFSLIICTIFLALGLSNPFFSLMDKFHILPPEGCASSTSIYFNDILRFTNLSCKTTAVVLQDKFVKRKISLKYIEVEEAQPSGGKMWNLSIKLKKGLDSPNAKKIVQMIKEKKSLKVTPSIQGDLVRVTGKKKDNLQEVMTS